MIRVMEGEGEDDDESLILPTDKPYLSEAGAELFKIWKALNDDDKHVIITVFFKQEKTRTKSQTPSTTSMKDVSWLATPVLQQKEALLGALLEDHENGNAESKVTMLRQVLARAGIEITGMHALLRTHMKGTDAYVSQGGKGGRHNVTFSLTDKGLKAAQNLREKHARKVSGQISQI